MAGAGWWFTQRESTTTEPGQTEGQPATPLVADAASPGSPSTPAPMLGPEAPAEIPPLLPEQMAELAQTNPAPSTPAPTAATPAPATPAPATPLPVADLPAGTVVMLAKETRVNLRFGASVMPKGARLTLVAVEGQQVRARFGSDLVTVPVADIIAPTIFPAAVKTVSLGAAPPAPDPLLAATRTSQFTNSLGMKFVPVPGTDVLFCIHETRRRDHDAYASEKGVGAIPDSRNYGGYVIDGPHEEYPAVYLNWDDAKAFCAWLSVKEGRTYRLPTDREWSVAVGIGKEETWKEDTTPATVFKAKDVFPWGEGWPPPPGAGNFADESCRVKVPNWTDPVIEGYDDGFPSIAPVMTFTPNPFGLFDLAGNASEWCEDWVDSKKEKRVYRGGAWKWGKPDQLLASRRDSSLPDKRLSFAGFRVVVELPRPALTAATSPKPATPAPAATPAPVRKPRTFATVPKSDFTNTLGMKFIKVRGTEVHFCIHETRHQDYAAYAAEAQGVGGTWKGQVFDGFDLADWPEEHPVTNVNWEEARKFCEWLSGKEGKHYRLPTDEEWSHAAGIARDERRKKDTTPATVFKVADEFPWGTRWPPIKGTGNFNDESHTGKLPPDKADYFGKYDDSFPTTAPVMSFKPNKQDLYDLSGNVWEWCDDWFDINHINRVKRGGSWGNNERGHLLSSARVSSKPGDRWNDTGFRVVMDPTVLVAKAATPTKAATPAPAATAAAPAKPAAQPAPAADGWADLLAPLTPELVAQTGNGWSMKDGVIHSPDTLHAVLHFAGSFAGASYQVRVKLRQLMPKESVTIFLPVADRMVGFVLDGWPKAGHFTGLNLVNGVDPGKQPGAIAGKRLKDAELHELQVSVRLDGADAKVTATLDAQPLYEWAGPAASLSVSPAWPIRPTTLALGTMAADWAVSEVKVKRLDATNALAKPAPALPPAVLPQPPVAAEGWEDLLARLTPEIVEETGKGWSMKDGMLHSLPHDAAGMLPLPGILAGASYQVRVKVQTSKLEKGFRIALPVGDHSVHFMIDDWGGQYTGLGIVAGKWGKDMPGIVIGRQIKDAAPHDLEVTVRLDGANATITTTLDARPLHTWTGPSAVLIIPENWGLKSPGGLGLGAHGPNWIVSEVKVKLLSLPAPALPPAVLPQPPVAADGWADLLAPLTPELVAQTGNGWSLKDGELFSPATKYATQPLPGEVSGTSYQVRVKLRQLDVKQVFHVVLPVADRMTGFDLEGRPGGGIYTGLVLVNGKMGKDLPGTLEGKQVNDTEPHDLEVTVRLDGANATITTTFDTRPLYEWTGPTAALSQHKFWATTAPGALALGTTASGWAVSEVKVKRLEP